MADAKITALTENTAPVSTDILPMVDDPDGTAATQKITFANLDTYLSATNQTLTNKTLTSPTLTSPALGTPASGVLTNCSGTAASLTAGNVSTVPTTNSKTFSLGGNSGVAWAKYDFATHGGAISTITPGASLNTTIPDNAIIYGGIINSTTAVTSGGSATVAVGTSAGSSTTSILGATGKASFTLDARLNSAATFAATVKMTAAGSITFTIGTATLTAGVIEVWVLYFTAAA